ncbi:kinase-like domain, phloem protein 2-like protein [Tanacetum coccineum]
MASLEEFGHLKIKLEDIKSATNDFDESQLIGNGGYGKVYKGELPQFKDGCMAAFKRLDPQNGQGDTEFKKEIMTLARYKHGNIISLLGFCDEDNEKVLVYELASRGSLDHHLPSATVTWTQRLKICLAASKGLNFIHDADGKYQRVIHCDIKSANILLDDNWNAKVSDFGLSEMAPANQQYSADLVPDWKKTQENKNLNNFILEGLIKQQRDPSALKTFLDIAYRCLRDSPKERPTMADVVVELEIALGLQEYKEKAFTQNVWLITNQDERKDAWLSAELYQLTSDGRTVDLEILFDCQHCPTLLVEGIEFQPQEEDQNVETQPILEPDTYWNENLPSDDKDRENCLMLATRAALKDNRWRWKSLPKTRFEVDLYKQEGEYCVVTDFDKSLLTSTCEANRCFERLGRSDLNAVEKNVDKNTYNTAHRPKIKGLPKQRSDDWMEVQIWEFRTTNKSILVRLELFSYDDSLEGIEVQGIEFRPV